MEKIHDSIIINENAILKSPAVRKQECQGNTKMYQKKKMENINPQGKENPCGQSKERTIKHGKNVGDDHMDAKYG